MKERLGDMNVKRDAMMVQDACNLSGVVHGLSRAVSELRERGEDSATLPKHPAVILWVDKLFDMVGRPTWKEWGEAYEACKQGD